MLVKLSILSCLLGAIQVGSYVLPVVFWHPKNPIFACNEPVIKVRFEDQLNFVCPTGEINPSATTKIEDVYESMYHVENEQQFRACNATGGRRFLRCDNRRFGELCKNGGIDCPSFYNMVFREPNSLNDIPFVKGGDYFLIATSYRTPDRLDITVGGSCNTKRNENEYLMRLKIHVCTDEEVNANQCERCLTEACYYRGCSTENKDWIQKPGLIYQDKNEQCFVPEEREILDLLIGSKTIETRNKKITCPVADCTSWLTNEQQRYFKNNKCFREQTRSCTSRINGVSSTESRFIELACPEKICSQWKDEREKIYRVSSNKCFVPQTRTCLHSWVDVSVLEYNDEEVDCNSTTTTLPITGGVEDDDKETIYIVVAVFSSLLCFIIGLFVGSYIIKRLYRQNKQMVHQTSHVATIPATLIEGETYLNTKPDGGDLVNDAPFYLVDGVMLGEQQGYENGDPQFPNKQLVTRSVSFQHIDSRAVTPQPTSTLPRNQGRTKVARVPSTTSQILLLRHVSDAASFHGSRLNSENLDKMISQNKRRLNSTTEETVYDI